ncbi:PLP-dependent transferase [Aspergillus saccharolyticus JOP 1030-1]|uniref:PLP-dependent transferase n=1 Tax=Aspergillus saccharolyticus JOP 1030-1 TaxID=1450539 RepID=A0A318Z909_9EURO|nr:PLP-dependent transferase [Aspergillus saccharolyticus JOP 1030-1]PYH42874.1 PLP-dependent transferase [Aspergillus saccharolyticus JOP 1030-1]
MIGAQARTLPNKLLHPLTVLRPHASFTTAAASPATKPSSILYPKINVPPSQIVASHGHYLTTDDGREIFDATGGAAVAALGHNHPAIKNAIIQQFNDVAYCYAPFFTTPAAERIAAFLTESTHGEMTKTFILSSGSEAVEAALKLARQYFVERGEPQRTRFIARKQSYHGNTLGALATGHHLTRRAVYEEILAKNVSHVSPCYPYRGKYLDESDDSYVRRLADELEAEFQAVGPGTVCAFVAETMAGATLGCVPAVPGYFPAMKAVCDRHGALLILDEVMSGMGRSGTLHAWEQEGVIPDLQTVAKGLGAGYAPIGALLIGKKVVDALTQGSGGFVHSQTYAGHPMACAVAYSVQSLIQENHLLENVRIQGDYLGRLLKERVGGHPNVGDVRGRGLFWGIEFVKDKETKTPFPAAEHIAQTVHLTGLQPEHCISLLPSSGNADGIEGDLVLVAPAYNITAAEVEVIVDRVARVIGSVFGEA